MKRVRMDVVRVGIAVIAIIGIIMMSYLVYLHYAPEKQSFCDLGENLSCGLVNKSVYSEVFGIPISILGTLYFLAVLAAMLFSYTPGTLQLLFYGTIIFLGPSLYLTVTEIFLIRSICVVCEASKVLMLVLLGIFYSRLPRRTVNAPTIIFAVLLALAAALFTYQAQRSAIPTKIYDAFAQCLTDRGYVVYGSITCAQCAKQRAMFGDSFQFINEVECKPGYENSETERCVKKKITGTPTWFIEDAEGNTIRQFDKGVMLLEKLSEASGCPLLEENN